MNPSITSCNLWKVDHLSSLLSNSENFVPFVFLTETHCKPYMTKAQLDIENYTIHRADRRLRRKGGSLIYVHEVFDVSSSLCFDNQFVEVALVHIDDIKVSLVCVYRPPNCPLSKFKEAIQFIQENLKENDDWTVIIAGDFNLPVIDWTDLTLKPGYLIEEQNSALLLLETKSRTFTTQYVDVPTRRESDGAENTLDLFFTNDSELFQEVSAEDTIMSDHDLVTIDLGYNFSSQAPPEEESICQRIDEAQSLSHLNFTKANFSLINEELKSIDWNSLHVSNSEEGFVDIFYDTILDICKKHVPLKLKPHEAGSKNASERVSKSTSRILRNISRKRRKIKKHLEFLKTFQPHSPTIQALQNKLKTLEVESKDAITKDKQIQERKAVATMKSNPRHFYSYAKRFAKRKSRIGPLKLKHGNVTELIKDPKRMADALQNQFKSVFSDPNTINADEFNCENTRNHPDNPTIQSFDFTIEDIIKAICEIKSSSSSGEDGITASILKNCKDGLAYPIYLIWKSSFNSGFIYQKFLTQMITPVHKKGSRSKPVNYRPISLTSHIIKIFERIVRDKLVDYLECNNLLNSFQHGFRHGHSCLSELLAHYDDLLTNLSQGNDVDVIYLDFAKAFDKVDHRVLLKKIRALGISGKLYKWIKSFLSNRFQKVVVDGAHSFITLVISGVPQGTVLGPILFLIYLNDINSSIENGSAIRSFADDSRLLKAIATSEDSSSLQLDLQNVISWATTNNMLLHQDKFELMQYTTSLNNHTKTLLESLPFNEYSRYYNTSDGLELVPSEQVQDLGVLLSSKLDFSPHINQIVDKACSKAAWVLSVFQCRNVDTMMTLYKSMVRPLLEYCCPLWNPSKAADIQCLESVQRNFTSKIAGFQSLNYWERLSQLKLMSLQRRRERFCIIYMWKILNCNAPNDISVNWSHSPRLGFKAVVPRMSRNRKISSILEASFCVNGAQLWNTLPKAINSEAVFHSFKRQLDDYLLSFPDEPAFGGYCTRHNNSLLQWSNYRF